MPLPNCLPRKLLKPSLPNGRPVSTSLMCERLRSAYETTASFSSVVTEQVE